MGTSTMTTKKYSETEEIAQKYYNSKEADQFYFNIWGGEDIHIGLYDNPSISIQEASRRTVELIASQLDFNMNNPRLIDLGAGYGGAARYLAEKHNCHVTCLNISEEQNSRNQSMNKQKGLDTRIQVVDGSFEAIPFQNETFDFAWSQDSILHSNDRKKVLQEVHRILTKGGEFVFTDPMKKEGVSEKDLQPVLERIHLSSMGSIDFYTETLEKIGFAKLKILDLTENLGRHYSRVLEEIESRYDEIVKISSKDYIDRMKVGLKNWIDANQKSLLSWGVLHFKKV